MKWETGRAIACRVWPTAGLIAALAASGPAGAAQFVFSGKPIHPACVEALAMQSGDAIPVTTAVSLVGCAASQRSQLEVRRDRSTLSIATPEGGSFGYTVISTLDNGIFIIAIRRTDAHGSSSTSLAAVDIRQRPQVMRTGEVAQRWVLEMVGEVWLPDMELASVRTIGNRVHFAAGVGPNRKEEVIDLTRIGKARR